MSSFSLLMKPVIALSIPIVLSSTPLVREGLDNLYPPYKPEHREITCALAQAHRSLKHSNKHPDELRIASAARPSPRGLPRPPRPPCRHGFVSAGLCSPAPLTEPATAGAGPSRRARSPFAACGSDPWPHIHDLVCESPEDYCLDVPGRL